MPLTPAPGQYTTFDGSLIGAVNGSNYNYTALSNPVLLFYTVSNAVGSLLWRSRVLQDPAVNYIDGPGFYGIGTAVGTGVMTARVFQGPGTSPTRLRLSDGGLTCYGLSSLRLTPAASSFLLFKNGLLLTAGLNYTVSGAWISLVQAFAPGDAFTALISMGGSASTTNDGSITGTINGSNATFVLPAAASQVMLFRNGQLLTEATDYLRSGNRTVVLQGAQIPVGGDVLTAQTYSSAGPVQVTTIDATLFYPTVSSGLIYSNGLLMTQGLDATLSGNVVTLARAPLPG